LGCEGRVGRCGCAGGAVVVGIMGMGLASGESRQAVMDDA
jgi:hypothetical protein